jgi:hypothetical protein
VILLRRHKIGSEEYFQVLFTTKTGETVQSPLLEKEEAVEWILWLLNIEDHSTASSTSPSPSQKAGF